VWMVPGEDRQAIKVTERSLKSQTCYNHFGLRLDTSSDLHSRVQSLKECALLVFRWTMILVQSLGCCMMH